MSQKKVPKRAFRGRLPQNFTREGSKMIVSCEAASKFHKRKFQNDRFVRGFFKISQNNGFQNTVAHKPRTMRRAIPRAQNLHSATVLCDRPTESYTRVRASSKIKMCVSLQRHAIQNFQMRFSLQRRAQKIYPEDQIRLFLMF